MINQAKLTVTCAFKNMEHSSDKVKEYASKRSEKLIKYLQHLTTCHYVFFVEKTEQVAQVHMVAGDFEARGESRGENFFAAIDEVTDKLVHQCRKHKEKLTDHTGKPHHNGDYKSE